MTETVEIPTSVDQLTPQWLSGFLADNGREAKVTSVTAEPVGTGQMAGSYRLRLEYDDAAGLPPTMVAKLATGAPEQREFGSGVFRNEVRFYRDLADRFTVPKPDCFAATISDAATESSCSSKTWAMRSRATRSPDARRRRRKRSPSRRPGCMPRDGTTPACSPTCRCPGNPSAR